MLKEMFKKTYIRIDKKHKKDVKTEEPSIPEGLWKKCNKCGKPVYVDDVKSNFYKCPKCGGYFRIHAYRRIEMLADQGSFEEWDKNMPFSNPLDFPGYEKKADIVKKTTGLDDAVVTGKIKIDGQETAIGVCDARFFMGSMGYNVGEKITRAVERAADEKIPVILYACSGGARMQEGIVSLMQMAKTSAALKKLHNAGQVFISVLTDPTTGGVTASFAMLGDIIIAEPKALIGFAGPRVIENTIGQKLPEGFQRSEFLLEHGFIDIIVERDQQRETISNLLKYHDSKNRNLKITGRQQNMMFDNVIKEEIKNAWDTVLTSRKSDRPTALDYIESIFDQFIELHGDRLYGDDGAIVAGLADFHGIPVTVIGQQKGKNIKDNIKRNFGMPSPDGYRKALRLMKQAETFKRPIICFVDTPGAFCGIEAEERGQGEAIARNLFEMSDLKVPILSIVIGEGGSGGALALAVANEVWMLENSIYSILSPEGFASILWKDSKRASEAAEVMKITATDLYQMNLIEKIIFEKEPAQAGKMEQLSLSISNELERFLEKYINMCEEDIVFQRYNRFRNM